MVATWTKHTFLPCYLHLSIHVDETTAENSIRFPENLHLDHPSLEQISIKRVKSVEKGCVFPSMGLIFIRGQLFDKHIEILGEADYGENSGPVMLQFQKCQRSTLKRRVCLVDDG
ncbi:hypothetical protein OSTOST_00766 [Ostertagia ostertagi]